MIGSGRRIAEKAMIVCTNQTDPFNNRSDKNYVRNNMKLIHEEVVLIGS